MAHFNKERLVMLQSHPVRDNLYRRPPYVAGAFEEYRTEQEQADDTRKVAEVPDVAQRILADRFDKIASKNALTAHTDILQDERLCLDSFFEGTNIKKPCAQKPFSDSIVNPLRRRNNELMYFKM